METQATRVSLLPPESATEQPVQGQMQAFGHEVPERQFHRFAQIPERGADIAATRPGYPIEQRLRYLPGNARHEDSSKVIVEESGGRQRLEQGTEETQTRVSAGIEQLNRADPVRVRHRHLAVADVPIPRKFEARDLEAL